MIVIWDVLFDENAFWNWKEENVEEKIVPTVILEQNPTSFESEEKVPSIPNYASSTFPSPNSSSSSPIKFRSLDDVHARCNYCAIEPGKFEEAFKEDTWMKTMQE